MKGPWATPNDPQVDIDALGLELPEGARDRRIAHLEGALDEAKEALVDALKRAEHAEETLAKLRIDHESLLDLIRIAEKLS